MLKNRRF